MPCTYSVVSLREIEREREIEQERELERQRTREEAKKREEERKKKEVAQKKKALFTVMIAMGFDLDVESVDSDKTLITGTRTKGGE